MNIIEIMHQGEGKTLSIEIEPPALGKDINHLWAVVDELVSLGIRWIDITQHPQNIVGYELQQGKQVPVYQCLKPGTAGIAGAIMQRYHQQEVEAVPHVICSGFTVRHTAEFLAELAYLGVRNVMALRGDPSKDLTKKGRTQQLLQFHVEPFGHAHASDLIKQISDMARGAYIGADEGILA